MLKVGLIEQPLHTRYVPAALIGLGYLTAIGTGADSYWVPDHINSLFPPAVMTAKYVGTARLVSDIEAHYDPWTVLGHLVARNRWGRRRLGIGVTDTGRRNPAVIAQAAATLHLLTRGRTILGIRTVARASNEPYGVDWSKPVARFEEAVATIRALWNSGGELVTWDSPFFPLHNAAFRLPPYRGTWPRMWIASHGPRMLRVTGRYADGWFPAAFHYRPKDYAGGLQSVRSAASDAGRDPLSVTAAGMFFVLTGHRRDHIDEALDSPPIKAIALNTSARVWARHGVSHPLGEHFTGAQDIIPQVFDEQTVLSLTADVPRSLLRKTLLTGTPAEIVDQVAEWRDHGLQYVVLSNLSGIQRSLRRGLSANLPFGRILHGLRKL
ncbi:photosystem I reaction center subunit VIII [Mycobacterium sherrisii]|uniref:Photosystem I reaction center subunit VIII n=2 Tax=Mycobacterium sherrisii TaxID=243061 RepID=A0A1E3S8S1_9MYCO|nr:LLM class flavin-dependent oxidoreductase [Mycobacterium sherrisii]MCV7032128.1 LLM class flavin-dependent oxidoreductase [Mycobacterium sherrisii]ODQ98539.1 photosystem I reaction center subunit VIII [Mycobacterium sherrisii]ORW73635.1 photosystem I reaction center subunit VIII [Mycobacterium sherrisii]